MQDLLNKLDNRQLAFIGLSVTILVLAALVTYGFWPKAQELRSFIENRNVMTQMALNEASTEIEIVRLSDELKTLRQRLQGDMANLPLREMEAFIIGRLQSISWRNDITLVGVEPAIGDSVEMYREVLFRVELSGDYFDLLEWLADVSAELGFVVIKEFQLNVGEANPDNPRLTTRLLIAAYRVTSS